MGSVLANVTNSLDPLNIFGQDTSSSVLGNAADPLNLFGLNPSADSQTISSATTSAQQQQISMEPITTALTSSDLTPQQKAAVMAAIQNPDGASNDPLAQAAAAYASATDPISQITTLQNFETLAANKSSQNEFTATIKTLESNTAQQNYLLTGKQQNVTKVLPPKPTTTTTSGSSTSPGATSPGVTGEGLYNNQNGVHVNVQPGGGIEFSVSGGNKMGLNMETMDIDRYEGAIEARFGDGSSSTGKLAGWRQLLSGSTTTPLQTNTAALMVQAKSNPVVSSSTPNPTVTAPSASTNPTPPRPVNTTGAGSTGYNGPRVSLQ